MGKGVVPDSHPLNTAAARSAALRHADVVLLLGARLNWILHFGAAPKWNAAVRFIQVDIAAEELGRNGAQPELGIVGDVGVVMAQLVRALDGWRWRQSDTFLPSSTSSSLSPSPSDEYATLLGQAKAKNEAAAASRARADAVPLTYARAFGVMRETLEGLAPASEGGVVYVSEGANTMDISRSVFAVEQPRLRLDAGTYATMGVGLGYAIAAHAAYNGYSGIAGKDQSGSGGDGGGNGEHHGGTQQRRRKKIVAIEGDSAFGFSAMEVETVARYGMDVLIFVINNGGIYHGDARSANDWWYLQQTTLAKYSPRQPELQQSQQQHESSPLLVRQPHQPQQPSQGQKDTGNDNEDRDARDAAPATHAIDASQGLRSTSLGWEVRYELLAEACGGRGFLVRTAAELERATAEGFRSAVPVIVNVIIEAGEGQKLVRYYLVATIVRPRPIPYSPPQFSVWMHLTHLPVFRLMSHVLILPFIISPCGRFLFSPK
jgi:2-hydroxyacyl-CoA lyase 1